MQHIIAQHRGKPSNKLVEDAMLSKISDLESALTQERETNEALRYDCNQNKYREPERSCINCCIVMRIEYSIAFCILDIIWFAYV